jgi:K+-sensing histidine kinase KdpD
MQAVRGSNHSTLIDVAAGGIAPIFVAAALVAIRGEVRSTDVAFVLAVVVVATGALGGRGAGVVSGMTAAASFDFFHTRPYLSLLIHDADDVRVTIFLLLLGILSGQLVWRARVAARRPVGGEGGADQTRLRVGTVARATDSSDVIAVARAELIDVFQLVDCQFEAAPFAERRVLANLERNGVVAHRRYRLQPGGELEVELPAEGIALPVLSRRQILGRFVLDFGPSAGATLEQRIVAIAVADQVGASLAASHQDAGSLHLSMAAPNSAANTEATRPRTTAQVTRLPTASETAPPSSATPASPGPAAPRRSASEARAPMAAGVVR